MDLRPCGRDLAHLDAYLPGPRCGDADGEFAAILTDAFPPGQRGLALGVNQGAAFSGTFIGLVLGGVLTPINWRLIFLVSVPVGVVGTVWGCLKLRELGERHAAGIDWPGNITFAVGMILIMVGITYGIEPYGRDTMGWTNPLVLGALGVGLSVRGGFCIIETKVEAPMFRLQLFRIRAFSAGVFASLLRFPQPRRAHVHARHLAPGDLASSSRLRLREDPALGRDRNDSADGRASHSGSCIWNPLGSVRAPTFRHGRDIAAGVASLCSSSCPSTSRTGYSGHCCSSPDCPWRHSAPRTERAS